MPEFGPHVAEASIHWSSLFPVEQLLQLQGFSSYLIDIYIQIQMRSNLGLIHLGPLQRQCKVVDSEIRSYIVWTHLPFWFLNFIFSARFFINSQCIVNWGASGKTPNSKLRVRLGTSKEGQLTSLSEFVQAPDRVKVFPTYNKNIKWKFLLGSRRVLSSASHKH